jgi:DNA-binding NarL/FixJ family response regulator
MRAWAPGSTVLIVETAGPSTPLRVVIVDAHAISRAACRALLRTEGVAVLADVDGDDASVDTVRALRPDLVIVDVSPGSPGGSEIARRIRSAPDGPHVILTACAECTPPSARLEGLSFIAKADICARSLRTALIA